VGKRLEGIREKPSTKRGKRVFLLVFPRHESSKERKKGHLGAKPSIPGGPTKRGRKTGRAGKICTLNGREGIGYLVVTISQTNEKRSGGEAARRHRRKGEKGGESREQWKEISTNKNIEVKFEHEKKEAEHIRAVPRSSKPPGGSLFSKPIKSCTEKCSVSYQERTRSTQGAEIIRSRKALFFSPEGGYRASRNGGRMGTPLGKGRREPIGKKSAP